MKARTVTRCAGYAYATLMEKPSLYVLTMRHVDEQVN